VNDNSSDTTIVPKKVAAAGRAPAGLLAAQAGASHSSVQRGLGQLRGFTQAHWHCGASHCTKQSATLSHSEAGHTVSQAGHASDSHWSAGHRTEQRDVA
jgi:hypothetical protein